MTRWHTMISGFLGLALVLGSPGTAHADDDQAVVREEQILEHWVRSGAEVAAWRAAVGSARFDVVTARLLPNPELALSANVLVAGTPPDGMVGYQAQLTVPLPIFGQRAARTSAAEAALSVAEVQALGAMWQRAGDIQGEMINQAFADAKVAMLEKNLVELGRLHGIIETRTQAGANSTYDVLRVTTAETTIRAALNTATIERTAAETRLLALVADPTLQHARITRDSLTSFRGPENESSLVELALARRPDLDIAKRSATASEYLATRYRREAIPVPSVFAAAYVVHAAFGVQLTGGVSMPLPIFDRNQGLIGRALNDAQTSQLLSRALETRIRNEIQGAWRAREAARLALDQFRKETLPAAAEMLRRAEVTYQAGKFSVAELFDAYRTIWDVRSQELDLERQMAAAEAEVERAAVLFPFAPGQH